jgi:hypothetical protein
MILLRNGDGERYQMEAPTNGLSTERRPGL